MLISWVALHYKAYIHSLTNHILNLLPHWLISDKVFLKHNIVLPQWFTSCLSLLFTNPRDSPLGLCWHPYCLGVTYIQNFWCKQKDKPSRASEIPKSQCTWMDVPLQIVSLIVSHGIMPYSIYFIFFICYDFHLCICISRCPVGVLSSFLTFCHPMDGSWHPPPFHMSWFKVIRLEWLGCVHWSLKVFHGVFVPIPWVIPIVLDHLTLSILWSIYDLGTWHMQPLRQVFVNTMSSKSLANLEWMDSCWLGGMLE